MKTAPIPIHQLHNTLTKMDFGWMSKDQMKLTMSILGIEDREFYREEDTGFSWCIDTSSTCLVSLFSQTMPPAFSRRKDVCKTRWKRWVLAFLDS